MQEDCKHVQGQLQPFSETLSQKGLGMQLSDKASLGKILSTKPTTTTYLLMNVAVLSDLQFND